MRSLFLTSLATVSTLLLVGCGSGSTTPNQGTSERSAEVAGDAHTGEDDHGHDHAHPTEGPHHGTIIELGNEQYHAELVKHENSVTVYLLDGQAKNSVAIEQTELTINLTHEKQPLQFKLAASPDEGDPAGRSSRFTSSDAELSAHLEHAGDHPQLVVMIDGKQYRGLVEDAHGHDHDH